ncbi:MAG: sulfotransferase, partial [Candidatus Sumerlaeota bacterium]
AFWIDEMIFPSYKAFEIKEPVFIVGVPRSGTTFLHRVLARDEERYTTFSMWELLFAPSIIERKVIGFVARIDRKVGRPLGRLVNWVTRTATGDLNAMHQFSLNDPEEDFLLFVPTLACFILIVAFPHDPEIANLAFFDKKIPEKRRKRLLAFYKSMIQRHMYAQGREKTLLSKNVSFTPMLRSLLSTFPDARVVMCTRDPKKAVPSQISAIEPSWKLFGNDASGDAFRERWVTLMHHYYRQLRDVISDLPREQGQLLRMQSLTKNLEQEVSNIYAAFGFEMSADFEKRLAEEGEKSRNYKSKHRYASADYGLDVERIEREFAEVFDEGRDPREVKEQDGHEA